MNNKQILTKAICKARGYPYGCIVFPDIFKDKRYYSLIFSHDFARAFWGEEIIGNDGSNYNDYLRCSLEAGMTEEEAKADWEIDEQCFTIPKWQYHLQQMVLEKEPLKYLEKFLRGEK